MIERKTSVSLREYNSFGVEATADAIFSYDTVDELRVLLREVVGAPWYVLGGGNNILFSGDYNGTLLHPTSKGISITSDHGQTVKVHIEAAAEWDDVVAWAVEHELWGIENLSLIPGYAGAAPVQNIGAYGVELKDVLDSVEVILLPELSSAILGAKECRFGYRDSIFKGELKGRAVITAINLRLGRTPAPCLNYGQLDAEVARRGGPTLANIREAVIHIRESKLPDPRVVGNAGSFFKNPVVATSHADRLKTHYPVMPVYPAHDPSMCKLAAGWLIEQAGWKGASRGTVGVHPEQALVLVNRGGATGTDVLALAREIQDDVEAKFGIRLDMEVNVL